VTVELRAAMVEDAADVHAVTQAAYAAGPPLDPPSGAFDETVDSVAGDLARDGGAIALLDGVVVAALRYRREPGWTTLRRVGVVPALWRHGIGARLVAFAHAEVARAGGTALSVGVRHGRPASRLFWASLGYAEVEQLDHWDRLERLAPHVVTVPTADDMRALGARLATQLRRGDVVLCTGPLGAGKTTFAQGLAIGLGVREPVTSPTFVLAREHHGMVPFVHVDAYRLGPMADPLAEVDALDLDSTVDSAVTLVEWGEGLVEHLAGNHVDVRIALVDDSDDRTVLIDALGPRFAGIDIPAALS
jgi:tRNA threonylcarbamoyladenosine biosynthesis protein TsaE